jgi:Fe(II)/alpha-ketoglutarate-dependent arginine beta-hydroxylase
MSCAADSQLIAEYRLTDSDSALIQSAIDAVLGEYAGASQADFLRDAHRYFRLLPLPLLDLLTAFRDQEVAPAVLIRGFPVSDEEIGSTPRHWRDGPTGERQEIYSLVLAASLGQVFAWATLQNGRLVQDVVPIRGQQQAQTGHGTIELAWHTEDGFHRYRCDYLCLFAMRNYDHIPTNLACVDHLSLSPQAVETLFTERFLIRPDTEHLSAEDPLARQVMERMQDDPEPSAVLFGAPERPYLRIDPIYMSPLPGDAQAAASLAEITRGLEACLQPVSLEPGELLVLDNYRCVHGRAPFTARYDGTDRWLKKVIVTRDLRQSRDVRGAVDDRVLN